jgi:hypothetical protein
MSVRTRNRAFTVWANLRLRPQDLQLNNILTEILTGTTLKKLIFSLTGSEIQRFGSFDDITVQQKITRTRWMVEEFKKRGIITEGVFVDGKQFASCCPDHVYHLLWQLVSHDIFFVWERLEFSLMKMHW